MLQRRARPSLSLQNWLRRKTSRMPTPPILDDELAAWQHVLLREANFDMRAQLLRQVAQGRRPQALELLPWWLAQRDAQPGARQDVGGTLDALQRLGDPRAAAALLALRGSNRPSGLHDEHGVPITQGQLARDALQRLQRQCPELRELQLDPPGPPGAMLAAMAQPHKHGASPAWFAVQRLMRWPHLSLALGLAAPAWAFVVVVAALDAKGHLTPSPAGRHALALLAVLPAGFGLFLAARQLLAGVAASRAQRVSLACGALLSALVLRAFWSDLF
ncbi:MAG: hypothetical protein C0423_03185 [Methylibium sp.]|nr:hypothetical protein [Methylibium sp.]